MNDYLLLSIIGLWLIYGIIIKLTKKRKYDYSFVVAFVFLLIWVYFQFFGDKSLLLYEIFIYVLFAVFSIWLIIDNSILLLKKNVSEFDFHNLESKIEHISQSSELMRQRFISTIELLNDGISFRDENGIFATDKFIDMVGLKENEFSVENYTSIIHKDDLPQYAMKLDKLSKKYPTYNIKYRIKKDGNYIWIFEVGKLVIIDKKNTYISIIKLVDLKLYPETDVDVLNNLKNNKEMYEEMQRLTRQNQSYHLVVIQLTNIPIINEKYGRDFGDLMMGEYLSKLRFKFIKDNQSLFRISGIKFGLIIKEKSKFDLLDRALVGSGELLNLSLQFGGVSQTVFPNLGISESPNGAVNPNEVIRQAEEALRLTTTDKFNSTFCFYNRK